jgi:uncharacterized OB-fold protein
MEDNEIKSLIEGVRNEVARVEGKIPKDKASGDEEKSGISEVCPDCGGSLTSKVKYCPFCGCELEWD